MADWAPQSARPLDEDAAYTPTSARPLDEAPAAAPAPGGPDGWDAAGRGLVQGGTLSFGDEIAGAVGSPILALYKRYLQSKSVAAHTAPGARLPGQMLSNAPGDVASELGQNYTDIRDQERAKNEAAQAAHGTAYGAGRIAGGLATAPLIPAVGGGTLAGSVATGFGLGAADGLGDSQANNAGDMLVDTSKGALLGAAGGAIGHGVGVLAGKVPAALEKLGVNQLRRAITGGANSLSTKAGLTDDTVRALDDMGALKLIDSPQRISRRLTGMKASAGAEKAAVMDTFAQKGVWGPTAEDMLAKFNELATQASRKNLNPVVENEFRTAAARLKSKAEDLFDAGELGPNGELPLKIAEDLKGGLQDDARDEYRKLDGVKRLGHARMDAAAAFRSANDSAVDNGAEAAGLSPEIVQRFHKAKELYGHLAAAKGMAAQGAARAENRATIGMGALLAGAGAFGTGVVTGNPGLMAKGAMMAGGTQLARNYGSAFAGKSLRGLGKIGMALVKNPASLGRWGGVLGAAFQRGLDAGGTPAAAQQAVANTHYTLSQTDPDYQQHIDSLPDDEDNQDQQP